MYGLPMTNEKFCDVHSSENGRRQPLESIRAVQVEQWMSVRGKKRLFINRVDFCLKDVADKITTPAKALGIEFERNWKTEVWQTSDTGKKYKTLMTMDELLAHLDQVAKDKEIAELRARAR